VAKDLLHIADADAVGNHDGRRRSSKVVEAEAVEARPLTRRSPDPRSEVVRAERTAARCSEEESVCFLTAVVLDVVSQHGDDRQGEGDGSPCCGGLGSFGEQPTGRFADALRHGERATSEVDRAQSQPGYLAEAQPESRPEVEHCSVLRRQLSGQSFDLTRADDLMAGG
jgi:hypothetical protein